MTRTTRTTRPSPSRRKYNRAVPLAIHSPDAAIPVPLPLPYPSTVREALAANHEQMHVMLGNTSVLQYYSVTKEELKAGYLANRKLLAAKLEESLYIYEGVPMADHVS